MHLFVHCLTSPQRFKCTTTKRHTIIKTKQNESEKVGLGEILRVEIQNHGEK